MSTEVYTPRPMHLVRELNLKVNVTYGGSSLSDQQSSEDAKLFMFVMWGVLIPVIAVAGLVGNVLTLVVLWRKEMRSTTILYLRGMVITDTGILIGSVITLTPLSCANYLEGENLLYFKDSIYPLLHTPGYYIMMVLQQCNVWITVSVSVERYIAICHPFRAGRLISRRKTLTVLTCVAVFSCLYNIPHLFATTVGPCSSAATPINVDEPTEYKTHTEYHGDGWNLTTNFSTTAFLHSIFPTTLPTPLVPTEEHPCLELVTTEFGNTPLYLAFRQYVYTIIIFIIPLKVLFILNCFLIWELMLMQRRRSGTNIHDENEANLSLVLVLIVIVFIFCQTPGLVSQFDAFPVESFMYWLSFSNVLFALNSAVNFLIYTAFGRKFRRVLLRVFRHVCWNKHRRSQSSFHRTQYTDPDFDTFEDEDALQNTSLRPTQHHLKGVTEQTPLSLQTLTSCPAVNGLNANSCTNGTAHLVHPDNDLSPLTGDSDGQKVSSHNEDVSLSLPSPTDTV